MILNLNGRRKEYTARGLRRMICVRCHLFNAVEQWHLSPCILGNPNRWQAICLHCDVELNDLILQFWNVPNRVQLIREYRALLLKKHGEPQRV
jgi:hypothetical protein